MLNLERLSVPALQNWLKKIPSGITVQDLIRAELRRREVEASELQKALRGESEENVNGKGDSREAEAVAANEIGFIKKGGTRKANPREP